MKMRRPILNLTLLVIILTLSFSFITVLPATSQDKGKIILKLEALRGMVKDEHPCLANKVNAVIHQIEAGAFNGALNKMVNDVNKTITKWAANPTELYPLVNEIVDLIKGITPPTPPTPNFTISANPDELEIMQNSSGTSTITVKSLHDFNQRINLSAELTPATNKVTLNLVPTWVIPTPQGNTSTLTIAVAADAETGEYVITVSGTNGTLQHNVKIELEVTELPIPPPFKDFSLEASPTSLVIPQGGSAISAITVTSLDGFNQIVNLTLIFHLISNVNVTLYPSLVSPKPNIPAISILTIDVASTANIGTYNITIIGTSGSLHHSVNIVLEVTAPPVPPTSDFAIAASPTSLSIQQGDSDKSTIIVASLKGFNKPVDLTVTSTTITGVNTTLDPLQVIPPSNSFATSILTVNVATDALVGAYTITVTGTSNSLTHSANVSLIVTAPPPPPTPDFSVTAPPELTVEQGGSDKSTIIVASLNDFNKNVALTITPESISSVKLTLNPSEVTPEANGFATSKLTIEVATDASPSQHIITVTGKSDALEHSFNISLTVMIEKTPPTIVSILRQPEEPSYNQTVTVLASVTDLVSGVKKVILSYAKGTTWKNKTMTLKEDSYKATIPAFPFNTTINYRVYATDNVGNWAAPSSVYSYVVADPYPPEIGFPSWSPENPAANENITITVTVTEPPYSSGVKDVTLWYANTTIDVWVSVPMTLKNGNWTATINHQSDTTVTFLIKASDNAENTATSEEYEFTVTAPPGVPLAWILLAIAIIGAGTGGTIYYWRRRRKKSRGTTA